MITFDASQFLILGYIFLGLLVVAWITDRIIEHRKPSCDHAEDFGEIQNALRDMVTLLEDIHTFTEGTEKSVDLVVDATQTSHTLLHDAVVALRAIRNTMPEVSKR